MTEQRKHELEAMFEVLNSLPKPDMMPIGEKKLKAMEQFLAERQRKKQRQAN